MSKASEYKNKHAAAIADLPAEERPPGESIQNKARVDQAGNITIHGAFTEDEANDLIDWIKDVLE